jgi:predicted metal-dependent enzyme (double-stranded beta helix superfamily)
MDRSKLPLAGIEEQGTMQTNAVTESEFAVRECATSIIDLVRRVGPTGPALLEGLREPIAKLLKRPNLLELGVKREGNHIDNSKYLYYDGQLIITLDQFPKGKRIPPHDHGVWEALCIYRGAVSHTVYERKDDGSKPGYADLAKLDDRTLRHGDISIVAMPAEIHGFTATEDDTWSLTVVGGHYAATRHYFNPEEKSCVARQPKAMRPAA